MRTIHPDACPRVCPRPGSRGQGEGRSLRPALSSGGYPKGPVGPPPLDEPLGIGDSVAVDASLSRTPKSTRHPKAHSVRAGDGTAQTFCK